MDEIAQNFFTEMQNRYKCQLVGVGGSVYEHPGMDDQWFIYHFQYDLTKDQARYLALSCAEGFINSVNQNERYRHYLPRPYSYENLHLTIGFKDLNGEALTYPKLGEISLRKEVLYYKNYVGAFLSPDCKKIIEGETLEEALALNEAYLKRVEAGLETLPF